MRVAAYAHTSPDKVVVKLKSQGVKPNQMFIVKGGTIFTKVRDKEIKYVLFLSMSEFRANMKVRSRVLTKYTCIVFDAAMSLIRYTVTPMDYEIQTLHLDGVTELEPSFDMTTVEDKEFTRTSFDPITEAVEEVKAKKTILNQFMTFIYSLPSSTHQKPVKEKVCAWFVTKQSVNVLINKLKNDKRLPLTEKQLQRLHTILSSDTAQLYKKALIEGGDSEELSLKHVISAYEINYIRAINAQGKK
jgi:hypothetical protein